MSILYAPLGAKYLFLRGQMSTVYVLSTCTTYIYFTYVVELLTTAGKIRTRVAQQHFALLFACHHAGCRENTHIRFSMSHFCPAFL